jgi:hypothetical protein
MRLQCPFLSPSGRNTSCEDKARGLQRIKLRLPWRGHCLPEPLRESSRTTREPTPQALIMLKKAREGGVLGGCHNLAGRLPDSHLRCRRSTGNRLRRLAATGRDFYYETKCRIQRLPKVVKRHCVMGVPPHRCSPQRNRRGPVSPRTGPLFLVALPRSRLIHLAECLAPCIGRTQRGRFPNFLRG